MSEYKNETYPKCDALALAELLKTGEVAPVELTEIAIGLIEAQNPKLNAVVFKDFERALDRARDCKKEGIFAGVPYLIKDMATSWQDNPMTWSCPYFADLVSPADMLLTSRVRASGVIPLGNTHVPEVGWCLSSESTMYGVTRNPWKEGISAGGSSGGSAAAVAARVVPIADAGDAAGSIRLPASYNGLVGLKPSRGRISFGPNQVDLFCGGGQLHCVSRSVRDSAAFLDVTSGTLPGEPYNQPAPATSFLDSVGRDVGQLKIGFTLCSPDGAALDHQVSRAVRHTVDQLGSLQHHIVEHDLDFEWPEAWKRYTDVIAVEMASMFDHFAPVVGRSVSEQDVTPTIWSMIQYGHSLSGVEYADSVASVRGATVQIASQLDQFDVWVCPVVTTPPRPIGHWDMQEPDIHKYNERMGLDCVFTAPFNWSGLPAMSVPMGMTDDGAPIGVQLVARHGDEATLFAVAAQLEALEGWDKKAPPGVLAV